MRDRLFTADLLAAGAHVTGLELSLPMLRYAGKRASGHSFLMVRGDMRRLPFGEGFFDKTVSVTAIEFLHEEGRDAVAEMFRVTRPGGLVVVASLNGLSPWAARRKAVRDHPIFAHACFRTPAEMAALAPFPPLIRTAVHFLKDEESSRAVEIEKDGDTRGLDTGAFLVACWQKP
jgi:SAM-dependent methyltransferase